MADSRVLTESLARWCSSAVDPAAFSEGLFDRISVLVPFEGAFLAAVDPATLLYTRAYRRDMPPEASTAFVEAELGDHDVNQLRDLVRSPQQVGWLDRATHGDRMTAQRYRTAMLPFGLGDELRVALIASGTCWGLLCLHRAQGRAGFDARDAALVQSVATPVAHALRRALVHDGTAAGTLDGWDGPGVLLLEPDGTLRTSTAAGSRWLAELAELDRPRQQHLPTVVSGVVERLRAQARQGPAGPDLGLARARALTPSGQWLTVHAARLDDPLGTVAVIVEPTGPVELAPVLLAAYGLTRREAEVARALLVGDSRKMIASALHLSPFTVDDHVKSVFDKTGVASAGQLRLQLFRQ